MRGFYTRTATLAAQAARQEGASPQLQALSDLSAAQSRAYSAYCGLPQAPPPADTPAQVLTAAHAQLADDAASEAAQRPDPWQVADSALAVGVGVASLFTGVAGTRVLRFLHDALAKAAALREIVPGNERFKREQPKQAPTFKAAHDAQSPTTRRLVAAVRVATASPNGSAATLRWSRQARHGRPGLNCRGHSSAAPRARRGCI